MSVDAASKHFINRDFALAAGELGPLPFPPQAKPWILYFALCDRAFVEPDRAEWPLNGRERKTLRAAVLKGEIWEPMLLVWQSASNVPAVVVTAALSVTAKHRGDAAPAARFAESFIAGAEDRYWARSVASAFIRHILVELQHDYVYARELANGELFASEAAEQARILAAISEHELQHEAAQREEAELLAQQEQQRLASAIAEAQPPPVSEESQQQQPVPETESASHQAPARAGRHARLSRPQRSLAEVWRSWFREFIRSQGLYNFLLFVLFVGGLASSAGLRRQALRLRTWMWATLTQSLKMGFTVTYL